MPKERKDFLVRNLKVCLERIKKNSKKADNILDVYNLEDIERIVNLLLSDSEKDNEGAASISWFCPLPHERIEYLVVIALDRIIRL